MSLGIAIYIGEAPAAHFNQGKLFRVYPSLSNFEDLRHYVVVAYSARATDHGQPETSIFATNEDGAPVTCLDRGAEELMRHERIVGKYDVTAALSNLRTGYHQVTDEEFPALRKAAHQAAKDFATSRICLREKEALEYADNNWGMFAASLLDAERGPLVQTKNTIDWKAIDEEDEARATDPDFEPFN